MAENENTEHFGIVKPHQDNNISEEVFKLQQAFDIIDGLFHAVALDLLSKMDKDTALTIENISGLTEALANKMAKDRTFKLAEMTDVTGIGNALDNYILTKAGDIFVFRSALAVIGAHTHDIANIVGLQAILNTLAAGTSGVIDGEIVLFQGATGKALKGSGIKLADLILSLDGKATSAQLNALSDAIALSLADKQDELGYTPVNRSGGTMAGNATVPLGVVTKQQMEAAVAAFPQWPGVYSGTDAANVNFPIGQLVLSIAGTGARNWKHTLYIGVAGSQQGIFSNSSNIAGGSVALSGVWAHRGQSTATAAPTLFERVE